jgi:pyruvate dehydrogenase E2 component (dihydrolipoamide acetyltransferase)
MTEFRMPSLGADMQQATVLEWLIAPGDTVRKGQVVAVVDTDKSAMDIESFEDGVVGELLVPVGATVPVGTPLAVFGLAAPTPAPPARRKRRTAPTAGTRPEPSPAPLPVASPPVRQLARRLGVQLTELHGTGPQGQVTHADVESAAASRAVPAPPPSPSTPPAPTLPARTSSRTRISPLARRLAQERGVDLTTVHGTGQDGAIVAADVRAVPPAEPLASREQPAPTEPARPTTLPPTPTAPPTTPAPAARSAAMRHAIGVLMARSKREVPHYYLSTTVDLGRATAGLAELNEQRPLGQRLVPAALLLAAAARAARKVPQLNGFWQDDHFVPAEHVNLAVAVSLRGGGLIAPAIPDADRLGADELMAALRDLVTRARAGHLRRSEMTGGTLTVTNLGDRGVEAVFGVIYPPQVALVGFGRVVERPWAVDGLLGVRPVVTVTLSADHRASDGHVGGLYLTAVEALLQRPEEL